DNRRVTVSGEKRAQGEQGTSTRDCAHGHLPRLAKSVAPAAGAARPGSMRPSLSPPRPTRRVWQGPGFGTLLKPACHAAIMLEERDELALGLRIALNVALRHGQPGMARELLHVPQTPADLRHSARRTRNEGAAPGMRRTAVHLQRRIQPMEP